MFLEQFSEGEDNADGGGLASTGTGDDAARDGGAATEEECKLERPKKCKERLTTWVGHGVHGSPAEIHLAASVARAGRAKKRIERLEHEQAHLREQLLSTLGDLNAKSGCKHAKNISFAQMLGICFEHPSKRFVDLAMTHRISKASVRDIFFIVAQLYLSMQNIMLAVLIAAARRVQPEWMMWRLCWEETGEQVTLQVGGGSASQQRSVWHIMLARLNVIIALTNDRAYKFKLLLPALIVPTTSAAAIHYQLHQHPWNGPLVHRFGSAC